MSCMTSHINYCSPLPLRQIAAVVLFFALLCLVSPGRSDPAPSAAPPSITQQGTTYIVDEGNGITVELSPATGLFRYMSREDGEQQCLFEGSSKTAASAEWIFAKALDICDAVLVRLWLQQFPALLHEALPNARRGETPLSQILRNPNPGWEIDKRVPRDEAGVVKALLAAGADPNQSLAGHPCHRLRHKARKPRGGKSAAGAWCAGERAE